MTKNDLRAMSVGFLIGLSIIIGGGLAFYLLSNYLSVPRIIAIVFVLLTIAAICFVYFIPADSTAKKLTVKEVTFNTIKGLGVIGLAVIAVLLLNLFFNLIVRYITSRL